MNFIKRFFESKMLRLALFIFMFFFIFKIIDHILIFFNINQEMGYIYFMWFTVLFLLFVLLPIDRSYFKIFNKVTTPTPPKSNSSGDGGGEPSREPSVGSSEVTGINPDTNSFNNLWNSGKFLFSNQRQPQGLDNVIQENTSNYRNPSTNDAYNGLPWQLNYNSDEEEPLQIRR